MTSGIPSGGRKRIPYKRWTLELLQPLYLRWQAGETLQELAHSVGSTRGRLRWAMEHYGLKAPSTLARPKNPDASRPESRPASRYDASSHYAERHYKGSFDL